MLPGVHPIWQGAKQLGVIPGNILMVKIILLYLSYFTEIGNVKFTSIKSFFLCMNSYLP
jgi:hypothetical protein